MSEVTSHKVTKIRITRLMRPIKAGFGEKHDTLIKLENVTTEKM